MEIPGLDKLLDSIRVIHMEGCSNMSNSFKDTILQVLISLSLLIENEHKIRITKINIVLFWFERDGQLVDLEEYVFQAKKFQIGLHTKMKVTQYF